MHQAAISQTVVAPAWVSEDAKQEAKALMRKGEDALLTGNIAAARLQFGRAADRGWAAGALAMGATFDPQELVKLAPFVTPDPEQARFWYLRAQELAHSRACYYLQRLGSPKGPGPVLP